MEIKKGWQAVKTHSDEIGVSPFISEVKRLLGIEDVRILTPGKMTYARQPSADQIEKSGVTIEQIYKSTL